MPRGGVEGSALLFLHLQQPEFEQTVEQNLNLLLRQPERDGEIGERGGPPFHQIEDGAFGAGAELRNMFPAAAPVTERTDRFDRNDRF